jgi:hypothetical protein
MMSSPQSLTQEHRAAIVLNNMGVSLLERRAYTQGMETLKDAIFLMKRVFRPTASSSSFDTNKISSSYADVKLRRAIKRMASPKPVPSSVNVDVIFHDGSLSETLRGNSSSPYTCPIRIEADDIDYQEDRDPDLESAVMLYNFGIAHICLSKLSKKPSKLQEAALKLFDMASTIVSNSNTIPQRRFENEICEMTETRLLLEVAVLKTVVKLLTEMGKYSEANASYQQLVLIGSAINELEAPCYIESQVAAAAAA